ncbi:hypothetical protein BJX61DRAFT_367047 [Aspergillus egyptiacus]|nr:hypothetical protein BJX61DRAFT_367047 [Aspergillus egyptiacus]
MASPVNVGDIYLLGRLAYKLGSAFTTGRKSAPAEFREVGNQLHSLSAALQALQKEASDRSISLTLDPSALPQAVNARHGEDEDVLKHVVNSCGETLRHLEVIVEKYSVLGKPTDGTFQVSRFRRWNDNIKTGWKAILWTKEGGDLTTLRSNLSVHTNSLNLLLGVITNSQAERIESRVNANHRMLHEIHTWFTKNLKDSTITLQRQPAQRATEQTTPYSVQTFELHEGQGTEPRLVCPFASIDLDLLARRVTKPDGLFCCHCPTTENQRTHRMRVASFALSPLSICTRIPGAQRMFMLYKIADKSSGILRSLFVTRLPRSDMAEIEGLFQSLSLEQTKPLLNQGMNNLLCYNAPSEAEAMRSYTLNLISDTRPYRRAIESVSFYFVSQHSFYERTDVEAVHILHYKSTDSVTLTDRDEEYPIFRFDDHAEIALQYATSNQSGSTDVVRMSLILTCSTPFHTSNDQKSLIFDKINCIGYTATDDPSPVEDVEVTIRFTTLESCSSFRQKVEDMRTELFIIALQHPNRFEKNIMRLQVSAVHTEHLQITDAEVSILHNTNSNRYRLTIVSRDGFTILSQQLPETFLESLTAGQNVSFRSPTYVVHVDESGVRKIHHYTQGFSVLGFSDVTGMSWMSYSL